MRANLSYLSLETKLIDLAVLKLMIISQSINGPFKLGDAPYDFRFEVNHLLIEVHIPQIKVDNPLIDIFNLPLVLDALIQELAYSSTKLLIFNGQALILRFLEERILLAVLMLVVIYGCKHFQGIELNSIHVVFNFNCIAFSLSLEVLEASNDIQEIGVLSRNPKELFLRFFLSFLLLRQCALDQYQFSRQLIALFAFFGYIVGYVACITVVLDIYRRLSKLKIAASQVLLISLLNQVSSGVLSSSCSCGSIDTKHLIFEEILLT